MFLQMTDKMNLIFEPADLDQASPATVSRCGMIYLEPKMLGWLPVLKSYGNILSTKIFPEQFELIFELINWIVPPVFEFIFQKAKLFTDSSELHLFYVSIK